MSRYIDADELRDFVKRWGDLSTSEDFIKWIDEAQTADVVEVVRCKDCKNCEVRTTANYIPFFFCKLNDHSVSENAFCCWGERKEE